MGDFRNTTKYHMAAILDPQCSPFPILHGNGCLLQLSIEYLQDYRGIRQSYSSQHVALLNQNLVFRIQKTIPKIPNSNIPVRSRSLKNRGY
jgi:hypothetical protein